MAEDRGDRLWGNIRLRQIDRDIQRADRPLQRQRSRLGGECGIGHPVIIAAPQATFTALPAHLVALPMQLLLFAAVCIVLMSVLLKLALPRQIGVFQAITWNYAIAALLAG